MNAIDGWHAYIRAPDPQALNGLLDPEARFDSPIVHTTQRGRAITAAYLTAAASVLGGPTFRYIGEWRSDDGAVLEFETTVGGKYVNGVDIIRCNDEGRIVEFRVMIRPLQAVNLVHEQMAAMLERMKPAD